MQIGVTQQYDVLITELADQKQAQNQEKYAKQCLNENTVFCDLPAGGETSEASSNPQKYFTLTQKADNSIERIYERIYDAYTCNTCWLILCILHIAIPGKKIC